MAAAAVVSVTMGVMKPVLDKLTTLMGDEYKKIKGLRKQVTFLQRELRDMDVLLEKMDSADELDPQAKHWRRDIIEMTYNIENCIDDFMHLIGEADKKSGKLRRACKYLTTFMDRRRLANEFQEIKTQVMEASERRKRHMLDQCLSVTAPVAIDPRLSTLYNDIGSLVGIETQKDDLVEWVMEKGQQMMKLMAIVGPGGLGKTTLANEAYKIVGGKFDCKAFVSVSQKPEMIGLLNSLLLQLGLDTCSHACQVQDPINKLRGYLQDRRYLVVVDDLWDLQAWDTIQCAFPQNNMFSRVVITTRDENVAKSCCGNNGWIHTMKPLSESYSKRLFFNRIFGSEDACPPELMKSSCEILKKCGGLPLAIITMASMLARHPTKLEGHWESIQQSLATNFATKSKYEDMMYILDLSYRYLPCQLKACFLYLGSFPEDHVIERVELVRRWVAEGFVTSSDGHDDVWDVAESYFNELVNRSMIQPIYEEYILGIYACRVHDMLLELIGRRCKEDNFLYLVNIDDPHAASKMKDKVIRRLTIVGSGDADDNEAARTTVGNISQIRSLALLGVSKWRPSLLLECKFVRVLSLSLRGGAMDLTDINKVPQLRYLKVGGGSVIGEMPIKIKGLRLLETLDLSTCSVEIVDAPRLSHLTMRGGMMILPDWIGKFRLLRTLGWFTLPTDSLEGLIGLGELTALSELHLEVPWQFAPSVKATRMSALVASLKNLCKLRELSVISSDHVALCADALGSLLSPPFHNLEALSLTDWTFSRVPRWISHLRNLRELRMGVKEILQEDVVIIGTQLPSLLALDLRIPGIPTGSIVIGGSTGFPAVERFYFDCDMMSFLRFEAGAMPRLPEMTVFYDADKWDKAPPCGLQHLPPSLEEIKAWRAVYGRSSARRPPLVSLSDVFPGGAPTRPAFILEGRGYAFRPREEDYLRNDTI